MAPAELWPQHHGVSVEFHKVAEDNETGKLCQVLQDAWKNLPAKYLEQLRELMLFKAKGWSQQIDLTEFFPAIFMIVALFLRASSLNS